MRMVSDCGCVRKDPDSGGQDTRFPLGDWEVRGLIRKKDLQEEPQQKEDSNKFEVRFLWEFQHTCLKKGHWV